MTTLIYDLHQVLIPLEREVILRALDLPRLERTKETVEYLKTCWVRSRLWKLKNIPVANDHRFLLRAELVGTIENLARHLEEQFYHSIVIPPDFVWVYQEDWIVEIRYNDLYLIDADGGELKW